MDGYGEDPIEAFKFEHRNFIGVILLVGTVSAVEGARRRLAAGRMPGFTMQSCPSRSLHFCCFLQSCSQKLFWEVSLRVSW